jgi:nitrate/nitrite transport system ATP-binding protein
VDFLVARSKDLSHGRAPAQPPVVTPGLDPEPEPSPQAKVVPLRHVA